MGSSKPELSAEERALYNQMVASGASETEIAKRLAEMGEASWAKGNTLIDQNTQKNAALESILKSIMSGETSFVDDKYAQKLYGQARENAANEYAQADEALGDKFNRRGLFGGGQHASAVRNVATEKAKALAQQGTDIYSQQAQQKAVERASALDALMNSMGNERNVGLSLTGMGGGNLGQGANAFQGVGANMGNAFQSQKLRPGTGTLDKILGVASAAANFIPWCSIDFKEDVLLADIEQCYREVRAATIRKFHYRPEYRHGMDALGKEFTGVIIEEVPENWSFKDKTLDLLTIMGTLMATVQVLQQKVEQLEKEKSDAASISQTPQLQPAA